MRGMEFWGGFGVGNLGFEGFGGELRVEGSGLSRQEKTFLGIRGR